MGNWANGSPVVT